MPDTVPVTIEVEPDPAAALGDPRTRAAHGPPGPPGAPAAPRRRAAGAAIAEARPRRAPPA